MVDLPVLLEPNDRKEVCIPDEEVEEATTDSDGPRPSCFVPFHVLQENAAAFNNRFNTDYVQPKTAWVTIDNDLHDAGSTLNCIYSTDAGQIGSTVAIEPRNGKAILLTVPAAGFVILE